MWREKLSDAYRTSILVGGGGGHGPKTVALDLDLSNICSKTVAISTLVHVVKNCCTLDPVL